MSQDPGPRNALWRAPSWATAHLIDDGSIEHWRRLGDVGPLDHDHPVTVSVVQRDDLDVNAEPAPMTRTAPQISVAGVRLDGGQARDLARLLDAAAELADAP